MPMKIIDTHIHVWDLEHIRYGWLEGNETILNQTYHLRHLEPELEKAEISGGILVQADNHFQDTDWMLYNAEHHAWIMGVVGWVPLMHPEQTEAALNRYQTNPYFKGVRHLIHDEKNPRWLLQPPVLESLQLLAERNIPYDVVGVLPEHIETALEVADNVPDLKMVFDHLNQPPISTGDRFGVWGDLMLQASQHPNFYQKISGQGTASGKLSNWTKDDLKPYIEFILTHFGTDRCFCGGDWPVSLLAGDYVRTWTAYKELLTGLLEEKDREKVFYHNAHHFYNLK